MNILIIPIPSQLEVKCFPTKPGLLEFTSYFSSRCISIPSDFQFLLKKNYIIFRIRTNQKNSFLKFRSIIKKLFFSLQFGYNLHLQLIGPGFYFSATKDCVYAHAGLSHPISLPLSGGVKWSITGFENSELVVYHNDPIVLQQAAQQVLALNLNNVYSGTGLVIKGTKLRHKKTKTN